MSINGSNGPAPTGQRPTPQGFRPLSNVDRLKQDAVRMGMQVMPTRDIQIAELQDDVAYLRSTLNNLAGLTNRLSKAVLDHILQK